MAITLARGRAAPDLSHAQTAPGQLGTHRLPPEYKTPLAVRQAGFFMIFFRYEAQHEHNKHPGFQPPRIGGTSPEYTTRPESRDAVKRSINRADRAPASAHP